MSINEITKWHNIRLTMNFKIWKSNGINVKNMKNNIAMQTFNVMHCDYVCSFQRLGNGDQIP